MSNKIFIDMHTHVGFNFQNIPDGYLGFRVPFKTRFLSGVSRVLKSLNPFSNADQCDKYGQFVAVGNLPIWSIIAKWYTETKSVCPGYDSYNPIHLAIDFKANGGVRGKLQKGYLTQVVEAREIGLQVAEFITNKKVQIVSPMVYKNNIYKWYGSLLAEYPNPKNTDWEWHCLVDSATIVHCAEGSLHNCNYRKSETIKFNDPAVWESILINNPDLKICFSHAGGCKEILKPFASWYETVLRYCRDHKNVYTDLSFTAVDDDSEKALKIIKNDVEKGRLSINKILYGSDYWMSVTEGSIAKCVQIYETIAPMDVFQENNRRFLNIL
jgi:hypothetical protein